MKTILSLDLGITSIGYSILKELEDDKYSLIDYGISMFDKPTDKDGKSKKLLHSASASASKLVNLRKKRKKNLAKFFEECGLGEKEYFLYYEKLWQNKNHGLTPKWELRAKKVFEEKLKIEELFSVFYAIAKHRGYKSLDINELLEELCEVLKLDIEIKQTKKDEEKGKIKQALKTIENLKVENPNKTVATIIYEQEMKNNTPTFRNHDNYKYMIRREYINEEIEKIVLAQKEFGLFDSSFDIEKFIQNLKDIITWQNPSTSDENLFAPCEYYPEFKSAHQYSLISDIFKMYQSVSNITFNKSGEKITKEQIKLITDDFFEKIIKGKNISDIKYKDIRKILNLPDSIKIFNKDDEQIIKGKKTARTIIKFHFVNNLSKIDNSFIIDALEKENGYEELKDIFKVLQFEKDPKFIYEKLKDKIDDKKTIIELIKNKAGSSLRVSQEAMIKFITYFEQGYTFDEIKQEIGLNRSEDYSKFKKGIKYLNLSQFENDDNMPINNHPIKYIVSAVLRVVKHLHTTYGVFDEIRVESTRELSLPKEVRDKIDKENKVLEDKLLRIINDSEHQQNAKNFNKKLNKKFASKILMWEEQEKICPYCATENKTIGCEDIYNDLVDIDHIVPQSLGGLSVKHNLILVHKNCNVSKSNQLPINFVKNQEEYIKTVNYLFEKGKINWKKKINLLAINLDETFKDRFESKSLRATSYIEALTAQVLKRYYPFENKTKQKDGSSVRYIQGRATANIRKVLQVKTKTRDTNIHHAIDAILIGLTNQSWLQKLSNTFRENIGLESYEDAMKQIKKDIPLIDGIEPQELIKMIEDKYNEYSEDSIFYKDVWDKTKVVNFWVSRKPMSSKIHNDSIISINKRENEQRKKDGKKDKIFKTKGTKSLIQHFISLELTKNLDKNGFMKPDEFTNKFKEKILNKMYLYKTNPNDAVCKAVQNRADEITELLKEFIWLDIKDKEVMSEAKMKLDELIHSPIFDNNGAEIRKVKFYQTNLKGFDIRGGLATKEKTFIGFQAYLENGKLNYDRIDVSNAKKVNHKFVLDSDRNFKVYKNDIVFFVISPNDLRGGRIVSFLEDKKIAAFSNPKFPSAYKFQPDSFCKDKVHSGAKQHSINSATGIIKLNLDILGNIKSYNVIGNVQSELLDFIKNIKR